MCCAQCPCTVRWCKSLQRQIIIIIISLLNINTYYTSHIVQSSKKKHILDSMFYIIAVQIDDISAYADEFVYTMFRAALVFS